MRKLAAPTLAILIAFSACGGDDEKPSSDRPSGGSAGGIAGTQSTATDTTAETTETTDTTEEAAPASSPEDEKAVRDAVVSWLLEGPCEVMSDKFLESQAFGGDTREERCEFFRKTFQKPQYGEADIVVSDVEVEGDEASLTIGDKISNVESEYQLLRNGGTWQIDSAELK